MNFTGVWDEIPQGWQIFIATCIFSIFIIIIKLAWSRLHNKLWNKHPNTFIYLAGLEKTYSIRQLRQISSVMSKITIRPVKFPEGVPLLEEPNIPLKLFNWDYPKNTKMFTVLIHNRGDKIDRNIKIDIDFMPSSIRHIKIDNERRVDLIQGGKVTGSRAVFKIAELLPDERQAIEILINGKSVKSVDAWSEEQQRIKNIFIFDMIIEPDLRA